MRKFFSRASVIPMRDTLFPLYYTGIYFTLKAVNLKLPTAPGRKKFLGVEMNVEELFKRNE